MSYKKIIRNFVLKIFNGVKVFFNNAKFLNIIKFFKPENDPDKRLISNLSEKKVPSIHQLLHIGYFLKNKEKKVLIICVVIGILALAFLLIRTVSNITSIVPVNGGEYIEGTIGSIQYINPILNQNNDTDRDISKLVFSGLFKIDTDGNLENDLIKDYSVSDDKKQYTFNLKDNIYWHDGVAMTADDIEFTLYAIENPDFNSPLYRTLKGVGYEKISDKSFKLILEEPFAPFLSTLTFGILPSHLWQDVPPENITLVELNKKPIGSGPYTFFSIKKDSDGYIKQYTLRKFENYYGNKPYIDTIVFKFYDDLDQIVEALKGGKILGTSYVSIETANKLADIRHFNLNQVTMPRYSALFLNPRKADFLKELKIRQALQFAVNKDEIAKDFRLEGREAYGPMDLLIPPQQKDVYDIEKAKSLLAESGWKLDNGVLKKGNNVMTIKITTSDNPDYTKIADYIKKQWSSLGISVEVEIVDKQKMVSQIIEPRNYQVLLYSQILSYDPDPYVFWHSSQTSSNGLNLSIFSDKNIDSILEEARKTGTIDERKEKYSAFQKIVKDEVYAIFLFDMPYNYPLNKKIKGMDSKVIYTPSDIFFNIEDWYIKSKIVFKTKK